MQERTLRYEIYDEQLHWLLVHSILSQSLLIVTGMSKWRQSCTDKLTSSFIRLDVFATDEDS